MSSKKVCLALRLQGPMQSWGIHSQYNRRLTHTMPSKSAIGGLLCAALGLERGSEEEADLLQSLATTPMLSLMVPRVLGKNAFMPPAGRMVDFHTIQGTRKATGEIKECHITRRFYLTDAMFYVFLEGAEDFVCRAAEAVQNPVWGVWLGRKCCIPSAPVFAGLYANEAEALQTLLGSSLETYSYEREVLSFEEGTDSLSDQALTFLSSHRRFALRRVRRVYAAQSRQP